MHVRSQRAHSGHGALCHGQSIRVWYALVIGIGQQGDKASVEKERDSTMIGQDFQPDLCTPPPQLELLI